MLDYVICALQMVFNSVFLFFKRINWIFLSNYFQIKGFTIDDAIQTGVDNIGQFSHTGIVAGDEESYEVNKYIHLNILKFLFYFLISKIFKDIFDKVIYEKHGYNKDQKQPFDFDSSKLINAEFDPDYIQSIRIRAIRNVKGYCLPTFCTRGERRDVESILVRALYSLDDEYRGVYYSIRGFDIIFSLFLLIF